MMDEAGNQDIFIFNENDQSDFKNKKERKILSRRLELRGPINARTLIFFSVVSDESSLVGVLNILL